MCTVTSIQKIRTLSRICIQSMSGNVLLAEMVPLRAVCGNSESGNDGEMVRSGSVIIIVLTYLQIAVKESFNYGP